jgi:hypothetical protein
MKQGNLYTFRDNTDWWESSKARSMIILEKDSINNSPTISEKIKKIWKVFIPKRPPTNSKTHTRPKGTTWTRMISRSSSWYWRRFHGFSFTEVTCYNASRREVAEGLMRPVTWKLGSTRKRSYLFAMTRATTFSLTTSPSLQLQWKNTPPVHRVQVPYGFEPVKVFSLRWISQISHLMSQMEELHHLILPKKLTT